MLRDKSLVPLSRQHQHALALCVRIHRASPIEQSRLPEWQAEIAQLFRAEIEIHFAAEEQRVFPVAQSFPELNSLVEELLADHRWLRERFRSAEAQRLSADEISAFAQRLSEHIRKEERQLFERLQDLISEEDLVKLGHDLDTALQGAAQACALPIPKQ